LTIFPNPVKAVLNYNIEGRTSIQLAVYDFAGRRLRLFKNQPAEGRVDLSELPAGVYLFEASDGKAWSQTKKFIRVNE